jgi:ribonuclease P protein component
VLYAFPRERDGESPPDAGGVRFGVSVGRRVGGAVERNQVKRLLREAFWALPDRVRSSHDYVVVARRGAGELAESGGLESFKTELASLLERLELDGVSEDRMGP